MPTIFRYKGYRFFFYSNEGDPQEPLHVHVQKGESVAKFWLEPHVSLAESYGISSSDLRRINRVVKDNELLIKEAWHEYFGL